MGTSILLTVIYFTATKYISIYNKFILLS